MTSFDLFVRYHHLTRDYVDEKDYSPTQEYFLYSDLERGVVVYLPEISSGGKPTLKKSASEGSPICKDPIKRHGYNAIS